MGSLGPITSEKVNLYTQKLHCICITLFCCVKILNVEIDPPLSALGPKGGGLSLWQAWVSGD